MTRPIALTSGDPSGVGLELSGLAWEKLRNHTPFFLIADKNHVLDAVSCPIKEIETPAQAASTFNNALPVLHIPFATPRIAGVGQSENAAQIIQSIKMAVSFVTDGTAAAVCTNPINKKILKTGAAFPYPGHTEFLADLGHVERSVMMLVAPELRSVPVTIHIPLSDVPKYLSLDLISQTLKITQDALIKDFNIPNPRIAVAGLNPHAGENGTMGGEELEYITPLLDTLRDQGMNIIGPLPADTMFHADARNSYDVAICMYHDQALIPLKTLNFHGGVNTTLGLPFIRTSPDHGTAFDIAGHGKANPSSLIAALQMAMVMAENRAQHDDKIR